MDRKIVVKGFASIRLSQFLGLCRKYGKKFTIPKAGPGEQSMTINVEDMPMSEDADPQSFRVDTMSDLCAAVKEEWGWTVKRTLKSGSVTVIQFEAQVSTTTADFARIMSVPQVLNIELTPETWNVSYITPKNWTNSLSYLKRHEPNLFRDTGFAGKSRKSRFRRTGNTI